MAIPEYTQFEIYLQFDLHGLSELEADMESIHTQPHTPRVAIGFEVRG
ncbi:hypothetical protein [Calothrix sp. NIES-3974]|nr:hypothetical protein [Calothrix sp. NIES-3974]